MQVGRGMRREEGRGVAWRVRLGRCGCRSMACDATRRRSLACRRVQVRWVAERVRGEGRALDGRRCCAVADACACEHAGFGSRESGGEGGDVALAPLLEEWALPASSVSTLSRSAACGRGGERELQAAVAEARAHTAKAGGGGGGRTAGDTEEGARERREFVEMLLARTPGSTQVGGGWGGAGEPAYATGDVPAGGSGRGGRGAARGGGGGSARSAAAPGGARQRLCGAHRHGPSPAAADVGLPAHGSRQPTTPASISPPLLLAAPGPAPPAVAALPTAPCPTPASARHVALQGGGDGAGRASEELHVYVVPLHKRCLRCVRWAAWGLEEEERQSGGGAGTGGREAVDNAAVARRQLHCESCCRAVCSVVCAVYRVCVRHVARSAACALAIAAYSLPPRNSPPLSLASPPTPVVSGSQGPPGKAGAWREAAASASRRSRPAAALCLSYSVPAPRARNPSFLLPSPSSLLPPFPPRRLASPCALLSAGRASP